MSDVKLLEKFTEWKQEPSLLDLKQDYTNALNNHKKFVSAIKKWEDLKNVEGIYKPKKTQGKSALQPKTIQKQFEWRYPSLTEPFLNTPNLFKVFPVTFEDTKAARQNELVLNWQFNTKLNKVKFFDQFVRRNVDQGICILQVCWLRETREFKVNVPTYSYTELQDEESFNQIQELIRLKEQDPNTFSQVDPLLQESVKYFEENNIITKVDIISYTEELQEKLVKNQPEIKIFHPDNVYIDPSCGSDFEKSNFIIVSYETSLAELKKKGIYQNLESISISNDVMSDVDHKSTNTDQNFNFKDKSRSRLVAYEYWGNYDINNDGYLVPIVATWVGETLIRLEENPYPEGMNPFVITQYRPILDSIYGESDAELLEDTQKTIGALTRGIIDSFASASNGQVGIAQGFLDPQNRQRKNQGLDYEFNPSLLPQQAIFEQKFPEISQSTIIFLQQQNQEAESITGKTTFNQGINGNALGDVAAGIKGVIKATTERESAILRRLVHGVIEIARKISILNAVYLSEKEVIRLTNQSDFVTVNKDDLIGEYDIDIKIAVPEINEKKANDLAFMLQTIGPSLLQTIGPEAGIEFNKLILSEIAYLKQMPELEQKIKAFELPPKEPSPEEQQMMQLELQMKQLEVAKLQSEIAVNEAKVQELMAKAQAVDIDNQETYTGVKHNKDLEKQQSQSRGNQNLEITKGILNREIDGKDIEAAITYKDILDN
jgi:hypothetical protein